MENTRSRVPYAAFGVFAAPCRITIILPGLLRSMDVMGPVAKTSNQDNIPIRIAWCGWRSGDSVSALLAKPFVSEFHRGRRGGIMLPGPWGTVPIYDDPGTGGFGPHSECKTARSMQ